jgi:DNA-binding NtrC family response regulator
MDKKVAILVVSCRVENKKLLVRVFDGLPLDAYVVSSVQQAKETLSSRPFSVVFCEERLPDGGYSELLQEVHVTPSHPRFVVLLCTGEWDEYLEALRLGVGEVLRCPLQPTEVDLALIHAMRIGGQQNGTNIGHVDRRTMGAVA